VRGGDLRYYASILGFSILSLLMTKIRLGDD
jgi:hypothetical protein